MYEDVPLHLRYQLQLWTKQFLSLGDANGLRRLRLLANHMRYNYSSVRKSSTYSTKEQDMLAHVVAKANGDPEEQLRIIEFLLGLATAKQAARLEEDLRLGNSAYAVAADGKRLEMRVTPEVKAQVETVIAEASGSAGDHLTNAWNEAYGREPDPVKSYSESIKAVEAALATRVSPQNGKQTLGTMIRDVAAKQSKWTFAIADGSVGGVDTVLHMMRMLWDGQTSRHGGINPTRDETVEEAQAAVHLAATLVQFGASGAFAPA